MLLGYTVGLTLTPVTLALSLKYIHLFHCGEGDACCSMHAEGREQTGKLVLSFHHVGPRDPTQVTCHLTGPDTNSESIKGDPNRTVPL